jgi:large conductance mechanosensitive channel
VLFLAIRGINKLKKEEPAPPPSGPSTEVKVLSEIRDLLRKT